jgi:hypothetical protein
MCGRCLRERLNTKGRIVLAHPVVDRKAQQDSQLFQDVVGRAARPLRPPTIALTCLRSIWADEPVTDVFVPTRRSITSL